MALTLVIKVCEIFSVFLNRDFDPGWKRFSTQVVETGYFFSRATYRIDTFCEQTTSPYFDHQKISILKNVKFCKYPKYSEKLENRNFSWYVLRQQKVSFR